MIAWPSYCCISGLLRRIGPRAPWWSGCCRKGGPAGVVVVEGHVATIAAAALRLAAVRAHERHRHVHGRSLLGAAVERGPDQALAQPAVGHVRGRSQPGDPL